MSAQGAEAAGTWLQRTDSYSWGRPDHRVCAGYTLLYLLVSVCCVRNLIVTAHLIPRLPWHLWTSTVCVLGFTLAQSMFNFWLRDIDAWVSRLVAVQVVLTTASGWLNTETNRLLALDC